MGMYVCTCVSRNNAEMKNCVGSKLWSHTWMLFIDNLADFPSNYANGFESVGGP